MKVPQFWPWFGEEEYREIKKIFDHDWITEGPVSAEFSRALLNLCGAKYGVFAPNGTLALYLAMRAIGVGPGDEVIVPDFTFIASATAVEMTGAKPVFVDVNRQNFQIDLANADRLVNKKTKAVQPVHIYGTVADMEAVCSFAKKHNLKIVEDATEAVGVHRGGRHAGTFGEVGCFSFFADKTITTGEGGFIVTNDEKIYESLLYLRNQGRIDRGSFIHPRMGYNFRMTDLQSAVGLAQIRKFEKIKKRKLEILALYQKLLGEVAEITFFEPDPGAEWIPFRVGIVCQEAHELMSYLKAREIEPRTFFYPLHRQPAFSYLKNKDEDFPNSNYAYEHGVCLPTFPSLTEAQVNYVCQTIKSFFAEKRKVFYEVYDFLFAQKDYQHETDLILTLADRYLGGRPQKVLEVGCGTGGHTAVLATKVGKLTAIDIDPAMAKIARKKLKRFLNGKVKIMEKPVEEIKEKGFDLVAAMFNVVNYLPSEEALESFMKGVAAKLVKGGLFVFDGWNAVAVIKDPPKTKKTKGRFKGKRIDCDLSTATNFLNQEVILNYDIRLLDGKKVTHTHYPLKHWLWTPGQIRAAIEKAGMEVLVFSPQNDITKKARDSDWKILFCARKV